MQAKVFRIEVAKPVNYTWRDFNALVSKASYWSTQLANQYISAQYLKGKGKEHILEPYKDFSNALSSTVRDAVTEQARLLWNKRRKESLRGDIALPSFKNNSFWLRERGVLLWQDNDSWYAKLVILPGRSQKQPVVMLRTKNMRRQSRGYYQILERIASGEYKQGFTQVKKDKTSGKLYLLISYSFEPNQEEGLNCNRVMGVDLGVSTPACCAFNDSLKRHNFFVEGNQLLRVKRQIEGRRKRIMREVSKRDARRGHGRKSKFKPLEQIEAKWNNFRQTWNHTLSKRIVEYALKEKAGVIQVEDLHGDNGNGSFLGNDWPVAELLTMIENKASEKAYGSEELTLTRPRRLALVAVASTRILHSSTVRSTTFLVFIAQLVAFRMMTTTTPLRI